MITAYQKVKDKVQQLKRIIQGEEGNALIIFAIGLTVFLGFSALVTDVGLLYLNKVRVTNGVDAAALAGSQELPFDKVKANEIAKEYAMNNGIYENTLEIDTSGVDKKITVKASKEVNLFFAKVFGKDKAQVNANAVAQVGAIVGVQGVAPLAIEEQTFIFNKEYILKEGNGDYGWFGPLSLGGTGASRYEENLQYGYSGWVRVGNKIPTETGNISGSTRKSIDYRIAQDNHYPACTTSNYVKGCSRILTIPVIKHPIDYNQVKEIEVVGFAAFFVTDVASNGKDSIIRGYFIEYVTPGEIDFNQAGFGLNGVKLVN